MSHVRSVAVSVLIHEPLVPARVCMSRTDILGLKMFQLAVNVISITHDAITDGVAILRKPRYAKLAAILLLRSQHNTPVRR